MLDDAHHLRSPETLHGLRLLLRNRRSTVRLILASRFDPALPVARLRLEDRLCELRTAQLRFSPDETATLAERCGCSLTGRQTALLHARTDGWAAGIRLAALPLRDHPEPDDFLAAFSGDERPVADYLAGEVLSRISDAEGDLLRRTSICDPLPTALAAELSGRGDAADVLSALERSTGLVVSSGPHRTEFRIQELMRTYLTADLYRHGPALAAQLHQRAATWWAARTGPSKRCATLPRRPTAACSPATCTGWAPDLVARGEHTELRRALGAVEPARADADAWLPLVSAQIHVGSGDRAAARADVRRARAVGAGPDEHDLALFTGGHPAAGRYGWPGHGRTTPSPRIRHWPRSRSPGEAPPTSSPRMPATRPARQRSSTIWRPPSPSHVTSTSICSRSSACASSAPPR